MELGRLSSCCLYPTPYAFYMKKGVSINGSHTSAGEALVLLTKDGASS